MVVVDGRVVVVVVVVVEVEVVIVFRRLSVFIFAFLAEKCVCLGEVLAVVIVSDVGLVCGLGGLADGCV